VTPGPLAPALIAALRAPADLPPTDHDPERVREAADEILSRPEYQWDDESTNPVDDAADWLGERLGDAFGSVGLGGGGALPAWAGWLVLVLLVALVVFIVWRARAGLRLDRKPAAEQGRVVVDEDEEDLDWAAEAVRHEAAGRWRDGLRCRYRALAGELADREVIPDLVGRTAGEFVGDVRRSAPAALAPFREATDLFEEAWYGGAAGGPDERDRFARLADEVLAAATGPASPAGAADRPLVAPS
jgi:hypothetical protein